MRMTSSGCRTTICSWSRRTSPGGFERQTLVYSCTRPSPRRRSSSVCLLGRSFYEACCVTIWWDFNFTITRVISCCLPSTYSSVIPTSRLVVFCPWSTAADRSASVWDMSASLTKRRSRFCGTPGSARSVPKSSRLTKVASFSQVWIAATNSRDSF